MTFGPLVHAGQVEDAALLTLQKWLRTHLGEAEQRFGYSPESLPDAGSWSVVPSIDDIDKWPENHPPAILLLSPGLLESPRRTGDGVYSAMWDLRAGVVVSAKEGFALRAARVYAAAIRQCLLQHVWEGTLDVVGSGWTGERYDVIDADERRTLAAAVLQFYAVIDAVVSEHDGPTIPEPLPDPPDGGRPTYPDAPTAETIGITVDQIQE